MKLNSLHLLVLTTIALAAPHAGANQVLGRESSHAVVTCTFPAASTYDIDGTYHLDIDLSKKKVAVTGSSSAGFSDTWTIEGSVGKIQKFSTKIDYQDKPPYKSYSALYPTTRLMILGGNADDEDWILVLSYISGSSLDSKTSRLHESVTASAVLTSYEYADTDIHATTSTQNCQVELK